MNEAFYAELVKCLLHIFFYYGCRVRLIGYKWDTIAPAIGQLHYFTYAVQLLEEKFPERSKF